MTARVAADPWTEPSKADAKKHLDEGRALFQTQKWDAAITEFEAGELAEPLPIWLYNLGQTHRHAGHYEKAEWYFERFIVAVKDDPDATEAIAQARQLADDMKAAAEREPRSVQPDPNTSARKSTVPTSEPAHHDWLGWSGVGVGVIGLAVGGGFVLDAKSIENDADREPNEARREQLYAQSDSRRTIGWVGLGIGGVAALVGAIHLALPSHSDHSESSLSFVIAPNGLGVAGRF
jgi:tetratricopeptide (TPR) repeat protein